MAAGIAAGHHKEGVVLERFSAWLRAHGWTLLVLLFLPLAGMALFPFAHALLSSGKPPPVAMNDDAQLILFVTGGCGRLLMGFLLLAHSRNRNARLRQESMERSLEYQKLITEATKGLYESIYEVDVTRDRADSEETRHYFERLGIAGDTPFEEALRHIAARQIREEDRRGYLATFSPDRVLRTYREGVRSLRYEFMISEDGKNYYWLRIIARIFVLPFDQSVRMIVYRQNIDEEKHHWKAYQYQQILMEAAKGLYENIYEMDMTHNCAANEETRAYFESLGLPGDAPYDRFLHHVAEKQIKAEHRQRYLDAFLSDNVLAAHANGTDRQVCEVMLSTDDGEAYYWLRITARIFYWDDDGSVRMFVYRQDVDEEKEREQHLVEKMESDSLTGLYNKAATQKHIQRLLLQYPGKVFAFFILDIDDFKNVNDTCGHAAGDMVIARFARMLRNEFRPTDIIGRIGGDEFVVFVPAPSCAWAEKKARNLVTTLRRDFTDGVKTCAISTSIGVAMAPEAGTEFETLYKNADNALYRTKQHGKNGFTIYRP